MQFIGSHYTPLRSKSRSSLPKSPVNIKTADTADTRNTYFNHSNWHYNSDGCLDTYEKMERNTYLFARDSIRSSYFRKNEDYN